VRVFALLLWAAASVRASDPVAFPGAAEAKDPTGRFTVVYVAPDAKAVDGGQHELRLRVEKSGAARHLMFFGRSAAVLWAPDGNALAVTDRRGSDTWTVLVFFSEKPGETNLDAELARSLGPLPERTGNHHVYLEAVRWLTAKTLRVRLRGYGDRDPQGFDELFDYELGGRFRRATGLDRPR